MLFVCIFLWTISVILIYNNPKNKTNIWCGLIAFFSGFGGMGTYLEKSIIPGQSGDMKYLLMIIDSISFSFAHFLAPYSLLMYSINYSSVFKKNFTKKFKYLYLIFYIPPIVGFFIQPVFPVFKPNYAYLCSWITPYVFFADYLIFREYYIEKNIRIKQQKLLICILICPITILTVFLNFIFELLDLPNIWRYQVFTVGIVFLMFIFYAIKYGVLGVKLKIEQYRIDSAFKAFSSGTAHLNHAIKNGILKITMCIDNIREGVERASDIVSLKNSLIEDINIISVSANHLIELVKRFQEQIRDIVINPIPNSASDLINQSVLMANPFILPKNIKVIKSSDFDVILKCDGFHMKEAVINILKNSADALDENGTIKIDLIKTNNKGIIISISDDGKGISQENLKHVFDPFFTTKKSELNFGLGLFYCYKVMLCHGGRCDIHSKVGEGTSVFLTFNKKSVFQVLEA